MSWSIIFSRAGLWDQKENPYDKMRSIVNSLINKGNTCLLVSNRSAPSRLSTNYPRVLFKQISQQGRGSDIKEYIKNEVKDPSKVLVVSCTDRDFHMSVNSGFLYLTGKWSDQVEEKPLKYGIHLMHPHELPSIVYLLNTTHPWYYKYESEGFCIYSMTNGGNHKNFDKIKPIVDQLRNHLKSGRNEYEKIFKILFLSSLLKTLSAKEIKYWAYYPSSDIRNEENEIISDYARQARYALQCRSKHPNPLLIRHAPSAKRHIQKDDRKNPNLQLQSIYIHPYYKKNSKLKNAIVAIVDDYTTYGTSFAVAAALFKAAGVKKVLCFSLGKFGNTTCKYNINMSGIDPFGEIQENVPYQEERLISGHTYSQALHEIFNKIGEGLK